MPEGGVDLVVCGGRVVRADGVVDDGWVAVEGDRITAVGEGPAPEGAVEVDVAGAWIAPGFVDSHVHGGGGGDVMSSDRGERLTVRRMHASHGTTSMVASTVTASIDDLVAATSRLADDMAELPPVTARPLGVHLEGPFLAPERKGAHTPELLCAPDVPAFERIVEAGRGAVVSITIAPELPGALDLVHACVEHDVVVYVGHTDADYEQIQAAVDAGAQGLTHTFNCMRPLEHRRPGGVGAAMTIDALTCELILDLVHVQAPAASALLRSAGSERVCLVTDAMSAAGMPDGVYVLGGLDVEVVDGRVVLAGSDTLAGSCLTMDIAVRNAVQELGVSVPAAVDMAARVPADVLGRTDIGRLEPGAFADLVTLDDDASLQTVWIGGHEVKDIQEG